MRLVRVAGESMRPTFRPHDLLLTRPVPRAGPRRGDVALLRHDGVHMLKRLVGMPGDLVELEAGRLFVNGRSAHGQRRIPGALTETLRVPAGHYFVAGDNPSGSDDSRSWDQPFVPAERVEALVRRLRARPPAAQADRAW